MPIENIKYDLKFNDKVQLKKLKDQDIEKIRKFTKKYHGEDSARAFIRELEKNSFNDEKTEILITSIPKLTEQTNTEYVRIYAKKEGRGIIEAYIQSRYLEVVYRKSKHSLTNVFSNFWVAKNN